MTSELRDTALKSNLWCFQEARKLVKRYAKSKPEKGYVLFETGYGPSGLPHIGTFGEVARTSWVRRAFEHMSDIPTKLIAFSDDMDGLRKVPDNIPNQDMIARHLGKALTGVPDPFGEYESFAHHNNARLRAFLDSFGFDYEFRSATESYMSGAFDQALVKMLAVYDKVQAIMLPTLGEERRATYSPFMPVDPDTKEVLIAKVLETHPESATILYQHPATGAAVETKVTGGACKLQWKPDWAMRWAAFGVDYEMYGKDLIPSAEVGAKLTRALGAVPPEGFSYELFLDETGGKISKSRGNGISVEDWLTYAPRESLSLFMFQKPKAAKRLFFDVIPKNVDDYLSFAERAAQTDDPGKLLQNPAYHIHNGTVPARANPLSFAMLLNLASVCHSEDKSVLWGFISRYAPEATPQSAPYLDELIGCAVNYYRDFVKPAKNYRPASESERAALTRLLEALQALPETATAEEVQTRVYEIGKDSPDFADLKAWFRALYQILLGQQQGPRMGSFFVLYGLAESRELLRKAIAGEALEDL